MKTFWEAGLDCFRKKFILESGFYVHLIIQLLNWTKNKNTAVAQKFHGFFHF